MSISLHANHHRFRQQVRQMARLGILAMAATGLFLSANASDAYVFKGRPNCPWNSPKNNWRDYFSHKYGDRPGTASFSIRTDRASGDIGTIAKNRCYTSTYLGNGNWSISGYNTAQRKNVTDNRSGARAEDYKINFWGRIMHFNEGGEVIDPELGVIGTLKCAIGNEC